MDELKKLIEEILATHKSFQKANDDRIKNIEAGLITAQSSDKIEALNGHITHLQGKYDELMKQMVNLEIGGGHGSNKVDREKLALQANQFYARKNGNDNQRVTDNDVEAFQAYCKAFPTWLRQGQNALNDPDIRAAMQVGSDPDGGYWVPTQRMGEVLTRMHDTSEMRQLADVISITGDSVEWMNDANLAASGGWVGETQVRAETATPKVGMQSIYVREQYAQPKVTQKLMDMATIDVEAWLAGKIAEILAITENLAYVSGSGIASPRGFLDYAATAVTTADKTRAWGLLQYVATGASAGFPTVSGLAGATDADALIDITNALHPAYRAGAVWAMNRTTEATLRKFKDADGRYLIGMGVEGGFTGFNLGGFPIRNLEDMPVIGANSYSVAFGNFKGYQIVDGRGIRVLRDPYTEKPFVKFYTTKWTGGDIINADMLKLLKFSAS